MIMKSILAATAVAATLAVAAPAAEAHHHHINLDIGIGLGNPGYVEPGFDYPPPPPPRRPRPRPIYQPDYGYDDPADYYDNYGVSCGEGRQIVRQNGFYHVGTVECDGQNFKYVGYRRGTSYLIMLDSRTGEIIRRSRY
jgi:hypothetical protein